MNNNDPCWIGIALTGVLVKKSKIGVFGAKLYEEKDIFEAGRTAEEDLLALGASNLRLLRRIGRDLGL